MIEVLFTEGAAGTMQYAKSMKHTIGGAVSVVFLTDDGTELTAEQIAQVEEKHRKSWENAVVLEGDSRDVAWFPLCLSMGDITDPISDARADFLQSLVLIGGEDFSEIGKTEVNAARESLEKVLKAVREGEPVRIWYSRNPDELCGFCHLLTLLPKEADIRVVELPDYVVGEHTLTNHTGWGDVAPERFGAFAQQERHLTEVERRHFIALWRDLERENGALRAVVNGRLSTVGADFYDTFILRELERETAEFHEARLIGNVLGRYQLGIGDSLVALRIEEFLSRGMLEPVTEPEKGCPIYHRYLRKRAKSI